MNNFLIWMYEMNFDKYLYEILFMFLGLSNFDVPMSLVFLIISIMNLPT